MSRIARPSRIAGLALAAVLVLAAPAAADPQFGPPTDYPVGDDFNSSPQSVAVADFDKDSHLDVVSANTGVDSVSILNGDGTGAFADAVDYPTGGGPDDGTTPASVAVGDFDGDTYPDLAVANSGGGSTGNGNVAVLLNDGAGHFGAPTNFEADEGPMSVAVGNFDAGTDADLAVGNFFTGDVSILLGDGAGGFSGPTNYPAGGPGTTPTPANLATGEFDGAQTDLALTDPDFFGAGPGAVSVLLGDGAGAFGDANPFAADDAPWGLTVDDFDGDTNQDLAVTNAASDDVSVLLGDGAGSFTKSGDFGVGSAPVSVTAGDLDQGAGGVDLGVANAGSGPFDVGDVSVLPGLGDGDFDPEFIFQAGIAPASIANGDFKEDGKPDLAVANVGSGDVSILINGEAPPPGEVLISELRPVGPTTVSDPDGTKNGYVDLYNNACSCSDLSIGGWVLEWTNDGSTDSFTIPDGTTLPPAGHYLVAVDGPDYSLESYASPDDTVPALFSGVDDAGIQLLGPDGTSVVDAVGFGSTPAFGLGTPIPSPSLLPSGEFAWTRKMFDGRPQDTAENADDFQFVAVNDNDAAHGDPVLGAPGPGNLTSPSMQNDVLQSHLLDPSVGENEEPNRSYNAGTNTLTIRRTITTCGCADVDRLRFRVTDLTTRNSPVPDQAILTGEDTDPATDTIDVDGTPVTVYGLVLDAPPSLPSEGGLNASLAVPDTDPPFPISAGGEISVAFQFHVERGGHYNLAYNAEDDLKAVADAWYGPRSIVPSRPSTPPTPTPPVATPTPPAQPGENGPSEPTVEVGGALPAAVGSPAGAGETGAGSLPGLAGATTPTTKKAKVKKAKRCRTVKRGHRTVRRCTSTRKTKKTKKQKAKQKAKQRRSHKRSPARTRQS